VSKVSPLIPFLQAFKSQLETRFADVVNHPGFDTVRTFYVPPPQDIPQYDAVILWRALRAREQQKYGLANKDRDDTLVIPGQVESFAAAPVADDAFIAAAVRCSSIVDELGDELINNTPDLMPNFQIRKPIVSAIDWLPMIVESGGWVLRGVFTISLDTRAHNS